MKDCFMVQQGGGGNALSQPQFIIRRTAAIGDAVACLCVADKLLGLGYSVQFQAHSSIHCVLRYHGRLAIAEPRGFCHVNLDNAYEQHSERRTKSFWQIFMESANAQLLRYSIQLGEPLNCTPRLSVPEHVKTASRNRFSQYPRPWVFVCPRSQAYFCRTVPDNIWQSAMAMMQGTKFWLGMHPGPANCIDLRVQHFDNVINWLSVADILVTVDTGPMHVAAALGIPVVAIGQASSPELHLTDQRDFITLWPDNLDCLNCQKDACPKNYWTPPCQNVDPGRIAEAVNRRLQMVTTENVTAVVAIYKPSLETLNRCLEALLPQVQEIIVAAEGNSTCPAGAFRNGKITYVRKNERKIGYSRNINHGIRQSSGKWLLCLNDDCFLKPNAVEEMLKVARADPKVGLVSNLLRYPDGTIYHSGKVRSPGVMGWGHINHKQPYPAFFEPVELENCCGCCVLIPRKVFYEIGGFNEEYFLFSQDDDMALSVRKAGYKIMFTPHSEGIHLEHQSVAKVGEVGQLLNADNRVFTKNWSRYLEHNINRIPGDFAYV